MSSSQGEEVRAAMPAAARKRAAVETYARHEAALRRTARRFSLCEDDAEDALQRALEILLRKAPSEDRRELVRWTQTVVRHEALAVRRERERILSGPAAATPEPGREDWTALIPSPAAGPAERAERSEAIARSREALQSLKPQELRALTLLAEGYSYAEIGAITGFSQTKINRCLAEGRERFRRILAGSEAGQRCAELGPLISTFCDGEAGAEEAAAVREHLRACAHCRATLRAYRAAPRAAAALAPTLPLGRSLLDRAQEAVAGLASRFGPGGDSTVGGIATAGGTRGAGMAALAKIAALCVGTAGGAAACVATGVVPTPLEPQQKQVRAAHVARPLDHRAKREWVMETGAEYETETTPTPTPEPEPSSQDAGTERTPKTSSPPVHEAEPPPEPEPATSSGAVEYEAPPAAEPVTSSGSSSSSSSPSSAAATSGDPAGEFGP
ncbi:MAG: sigma-70 family RNA polymerase sigma factor [Actinobacteria bacterium]|nr:sigma-70 family RNA polymerase sigma factor [Actinomycetota bacterium]